MLLLLTLACSDYKLNDGKEAHAAAPDIVVEPTEINFGMTGTGCGLETTVRVSNVGDDTLDVTATDYAGDPSLTGDTPTFSLEPDQSTTFTVRYTPAVEGRAEGSLSLTSNDPDESPLPVPLLGTAVLSQTTDRYVQREPKVDVLWVIDNSGSMAEEQARVIADIEAFYAYFVTLELDYHMGVVTTDIVTPTMIGRLQGEPRYVTPDTADGIGVLSAALQVGTEDQGDESGLAAMRDALSEPVLSGENEGFYRPEAQLVIAMLSDEPEQSGYPSSDYIAFLQALKPDPAMIKFSAIVGDYDTGCKTTCNDAPSTAQPGNAYIDVAMAFPGVFGSICECSLEATLNSIGLDATLFTHAFALTHSPLDPASIVVSLDAVDQPDGWSYDSATNSVLFDLPPAAGQLVDITYDVAPVCG